MLRLLRNRVRRSERGAALMMIALSMTGVVAVTGVVIDGSSAFAQRRQMQNAADSAALAGTRALDGLLTNAESAIWNAVVASAVSNGASASGVTCHLVTDLLVDLGACPAVNTGTAAALRIAASGVKVTTGVTKSTSFIRIVGTETFTARATATAQVQSLSSGASPFAMCAVGTSDPRSMGDGQPLGRAVLIPDPTNSSRDIVNPAMVDPTPSVWTDDAARTYDLQSPQVPGCGQGTEFKGLTEDLNPFPVPGEADLYNGTHGINVSSTLIAGNNACRGTLTEGCVILVPLCHAVPTATGYGKPGFLHCVRFAAFRVSDTNSASRIGGVLVPGGIVTGGQGGGHASYGEARVIKLSE